MTTSLLKLAERGGSLQPVATGEISYPETGASLLESIEKSHFWFTTRRALILKLLSRFGGAKMTGLDVGCGSGYTAVWLGEHGMPTLGVDAHPGFRAYQEQKRGLGFVSGDIFSIQPEAEFDFALLLDTLEHIQDDARFFRHVAQAVKPGGILLVTVPAFPWLWSPADARMGHFRRYRKRDLEKLVAASGGGFSVEFAQYYYAATLPLFAASRLLAGKSQKLSEDLKPLPFHWMNSVLELPLKAEAAIALTAGMPIGSSLFAVIRKH